MRYVTSNKLEVITVTSNKLESNKLWFVLLSAIAVMVCFVFTQGVFAQEASGSANAAKKFNITFPVSTLGNCNSLEECKAYCEDLDHKEACINFAKSKGFYKSNQGQGDARSRSVLERAKSELGCDTEESCKALCSSEENKDKCQTFAKKYQLEKPKKVDASLLEKAKAILGCDSEEICKALCKSEMNKEKCASFAKQVGLGGGMVKIASMSGKNKDGLDQVKQIMEKCAKDPEFCRQNAGQIEKQLMGMSEEFCKNNKDKCKELMRGLEASGGGVPNPNFKAFENANPNAKFCRENPEKCRNATGSGNVRLPKPPQPIPSGQENIRLGSEVQGVSRVPSFFDWLFNVFLK